MTLRRHDLLDVVPAAWDRAVAGLDLPADAARVVADWRFVGRPVIVRRRLASDAPGAVPVALQLPNAYGRLRLALAVPEAGVTHRDAVGLAAAAEVAPSHWHRTIMALLALDDAFGSPTVFGGLMWQYLTGEPVLRATSDLDLLWRPNAAHRGRLIAALDRLDGEGVRIDGEIEIEDGAVSWRELHAAVAGTARSVVVKTIDGIELRDTATILRGELSTC